MLSGLNRDSESAKEQVPEIQDIFEDQTGEVEVNFILEKWRLNDESYSSIKNELSEIISCLSNNFYKIEKQS